MRYGFPPDFDIFSATLTFLYNTLVLQNQADLMGGHQFSDFLVPLMVLPIVIAPLIYTMIVGKYGFVTFIAGFIGGYYIMFFYQTLALEILLVALVAIVAGIAITIYARIR